MSKSLHIIALGKFKNTHLAQLEEEYLKRLTLFSLKIHELPVPASQTLEQQGILVSQKVKEISKGEGNKVVLLDEFGKTYNTEQFSTWLSHNLLAAGQKKLIFILGAATGHAPSVRQMEHEALSLSPLTFPHKLARLLLVEQCYRAQTIISGHPYHNA